jgi:nitrogen fixation/metabolism regulation signal transduction histidine kinase
MSQVRRSRVLIDPRFQLKYTALLVLVVFSVMGVLGLFLSSATADAIESAKRATELATRTLEESRANSALTRQNIALGAEGNPELTKTLTEAVDDSDRRSKNELEQINMHAEMLGSRTLQLRFWLLFSGVVLLVMLFGLGLYITDRIVGPVQKMKRLLRRVSTGRLVVSEQLRPRDELTDLFETFVQMTHSLRALERTRLATLQSTLKDAEESGASEVVLEGLHALRVELEPGLGMEKLMRRSLPGTES